MKFSSLSRHPLKRHYGQGDLHFITFSCYQRKPLLGTPETRDTFVEILDEVRCRHAFALFGYVVMPEHVHLVVSEPEKKTPSKALQVLKQNVAKSLLTVTQTSRVLRIFITVRRRANGPALLAQTFL